MFSAFTLRLASISVLVLGVALRAESPSIPPHPEKLVYSPLNYQVEPAAQFRSVLGNGTVVFMAEDRILPLFEMTVTVRTGSVFDPPDKVGLASLTGEQIRDGGTRSMTPAELDEKVEFLAANLGSSIRGTSGTASVSLLSKDIDEGVNLLVEMMRYPRFDEERLRLAKERILQNIKRRNDSTDSIENIEWGFLLNGDNHFSNRYSSSASINAITRDDLVAFHQKYYHPANMIVAVSGDFVKSEMLQKLEKAFADWPPGQAAAVTIPAPDHTPKPGVYVIDKADVNQGRVSLGHKSIQRGSPDEFALMVMDAILGGGGFRSRLVAKVRSDEGLAYSVGSDFGQGVYYPGDFGCYFQSKSNSCAYASKLVIEEINRIRSEKVDDSELADAVNYYVESFPQRFPDKMALLGTYMADEYTGRDSAYWQKYIASVKAVKSDDVLRVAKQYLHPDQLVILAVGEADLIIGGGHDKAPDLHLDAFGPLTRWSVRDPDTLKR